MARGQRPLQGFIRAHRFAIGLGAIAAAALLGIIGWQLIVTSQPSSTTSTGQSDANTAPTCTYADATFCPTEAHYRTLVTTNAVSDILESQVVTPHTCNSQNANDQYCAGASAGFTMSLYNIVNNGQSRLFTRNSGIAYLRSFFTTNNPLILQATTPDSAQNAIVMIFTNKTTTANLRLHFTEANGGWQLTYPEITTTIP